MSTLTLVGCTSGDWEGLYKDDKLLFESSSVPCSEIIEQVNDLYVSVDYIFQKIVESDYLEQIGGLFPTYLDLIPQEAYTK